MEHDSPFHDFMAHIAQEGSTALGCYTDGDLDEYRSCLSTVRARLDYAPETRGKVAIWIDAEMDERFSAIKEWRAENARSAIAFL